MSGVLGGVVTEVGEGVGCDFGHDVLGMAAVDPGRGREVCVGPGLAGVVPCGVG